MLEVSELLLINGLIGRMGLHVIYEMSWNRIIIACGKGTGNNNPTREMTKLWIIVISIFKRMEGYIMAWVNLCCCMQVCFVPLKKKSTLCLPQKG
jgi:hypothetical protein